MAWVLAACYAAMAVLVAAVAVVVSGRTVREPRPLRERLTFGCVAGLIWPVVVIGVVQFGSVALFARVHARTRRRRARIRARSGQRGRAGGPRRSPLPWGRRGDTGRRRASTRKGETT